MKQLLVEHKIGGHFNLKEVLKDKKVKLEFLSNDLIFLSNKNLLIFGFTIPSKIINKRKKTGFDGYNNIIKIYINKFLKRNCGGIPNKNVNIKVFDRQTVISGEEFRYIYVKVLIEHQIEVQLFKALDSNIDSIKKNITYYLSSDNPYIYKYI